MVVRSSSPSVVPAGGRFWVETLGCPKNAVDSDKLTGTLLAAGLVPAPRPEDADLVVVNTCAFIEAAREESVEVIVEMSGRRRDGARLVVTGCLAERYGDELAEALGDDVDMVAPFGVPPVPVPPGAAAAGPVPVAAPRRRTAGHPAAAGGAAGDVPRLDLLNLPRPPARAPWAYVKVAEGCDRSCGFCAIPSFRGPQRSRTEAAILAEVEQLADGAGGVPVREVVLVAQDLASWGRDAGRRGAIVDLVARVAERVPRVRLLYLYPSELTDELIDAVAATGVPYYDLSLQHVSRPLLRRMRRWGDAARFTERISRIRRAHPEATLRSSFIVGYPGETEDDHDLLLSFLAETGLDWVGVFPFSREEGTWADRLDGHVPAPLVTERLNEVTELADRLCAERRNRLVGSVVEVLVDAPGIARTHREAPEIDGVVRVPRDLAVGTFAPVRVTDAPWPDLVARPLERRAPGDRPAEVRSGHRTGGSGAAGGSHR